MTSDDPDDVVELDEDEDLEYDGLEEGSRAVEEDEFLPSESIARQNLQMLQERFSDPEVFMPAREYSQKDDVEEDIDNPNIQHSMMKLSYRAQLEFKKWLREKILSNPEAILMSAEELKKYEEQLRTMLFLSPREAREYKAAKLLVNKEDIDYKQELETRHVRACTETKGFLHTHPSTVEYTVHKISQQEIHDRIVMSDYQTNIWRKSSRSENEFGLFDSRSDPDFAEPAKIYNGYYFKPAFRPYNLTFSVTYEKDGKMIQKIMRPSSQKDYNTKEDINYLITSQGGKVIDIKDLTPEKEIKWEIDLRVSPCSMLPDGGKCLLPNPKKYKKIDPTSKIGRRILRSWKDNFDEWSDVEWEYGSEKKSAMVRVAADNLIWCYIDEPSVYRRKKRPRVTYPQCIPIRHRAMPDDQGRPGGFFTVGYTIRYSDIELLNKPHNYLVRKELNAVLSRLGNEGFVIAHKSEHDLYGVIEMILVHSKLKTARQRHLARL